MGKSEIEAFLTHLAVERRVAASTQNQALNAVLFLYRAVLEIELPWMDDVVRAKRPVRVPEVLSGQEVAQVLAHMQGTNRLMASLLYGSGLRLMEAIRLRVKDVDFAYRQIVVRHGKGKKDRVTPLPSRIESDMKGQIDAVALQHAADCRAGYESVYLPHALSVNTRMRPPSLPGNMCFRRRICREIHVPERYGATT